MTEITKEGTDERAKAEAAYRQKLVAEQQKRQKEYADKEKQHQEELKKIKGDYFGPNAAENKALYDAALKNLQKVYDAFAEKCGAQPEMQSAGSMEGCQTLEIRDGRLVVDLLPNSGVVALVDWQ